MELGHYIKTKRNKQIMSITELSKRSNISIAQISRIESGKRKAPRPETIKKLAEALEIPYEVLMVKAGYLDAVRRNAN